MNFSIDLLDKMETETSETSKSTFRKSGKVHYGI